MYTILQFLKNLLYFFNNRIIKRFLTIILIIVLLFIVKIQVFATDGSFGGGDGGGGFRGDYEVVYNDNIINFINDAIYSFDNYKPLENNSFFFYDENSMCYRCISWNGTDTGLVDYNQQSYYDVSIYNWRDIYLYTVFFDSNSVTKTTKSNARSTTFNTLFELPNTFNKYNFMFACYKSDYQNASVIDSYNNSYMKKTNVEFPFVQYSNFSYITDDYLIINPASTHVYENSFIPFDLELWNADGGTIGDNVEYLSLNLSTVSSYWDSENKYYKIPYSAYLQLWTSNDGDYDLYVNLFTNDHFYMKKVILSFSVENGLIVNPTNSDSPDDPTNPDYTQNFNNMENAINGTTQAIGEQTTVNRGIWGTLQSVLNFINPFSEDFFVYKLIELLVNALKSLFVPSDGFFNNWLSDLNTYFGDVFGILYYPFEILIDFLTRIGNIQSSEPIINIPRFELNFMGYSAVLFDSFSYNFNDLLTTDTFRNIHTIYLSVVDIILWLSVVYLASKCLQSIFGGMSDVVIDDSLEGERSYQAYSRYENNKKRYKNEH